jgi:CPA2 family monovalent cation:H+ antiporter-2
VGGQRLMRWWLTLVARRRRAELFMLNLLLVTLGLAWLTEQAGCRWRWAPSSAGMLVSETEYKHQVEADIRPFHDVLLGLFFITIGMMLDWHPVLGAGRWCWCCCWCRCFKLLLVAALARALGASAGVALRTGLYLAQAGEFGFVLLTLGARRPGGARAGKPVLAAMVLSMLATPFIIMYSNRIVMRLVASDWLQQSLQMTTSRKSINTSGHVLICGYGRSGQNLARMLEHEGIPYMALDLDPDRVRQAAPPAERGLRRRHRRRPDGRRPGARQRGGADLPGHPSALKVLATIRALRRRCRWWCAPRTTATWRSCAPPAPPRWCPRPGGLADAGRPRAGAGGRAHAPRDPHGAGAREQRYGLLRGYFHGADDDTRTSWRPSAWPR